MNSDLWYLDNLILELRMVLNFRVWFYLSIQWRDHVEILLENIALDPSNIKV